MNIQTLNLAKCRAMRPRIETFQEGPDFFITMCNAATVATSATITRRM